MKITIIDLNIAKSVFHAVGVDKAGKVIKKKMLRREDLLPFLAQIEPCLIVMEACSGANYWAREFELLGHSAEESLDYFKINHQIRVNYVNVTADVLLNNICTAKINRP